MSFAQHVNARMRDTSAGLFFGEKAEWVERARNAQTSVSGARFEGRDGVRRRQAGDSG